MTNIKRSFDKKKEALNKMIESKTKEKNRLKRAYLSADWQLTLLIRKREKLNTAFINRLACGVRPSQKEILRYIIRTAMAASNPRERSFTVRDIYVNLPTSHKRGTIQCELSNMKLHGWVTSDGKGNWKPTEKVWKAVQRAYVN